MLRSSLAENLAGRSRAHIDRGLGDGGCPGPFRRIVCCRSIHSYVTNSQKISGRKLQLGLWLREADRRGSFVPLLYNLGEVSVARLWVSMCCPRDSQIQHQTEAAFPHEMLPCTAAYQILAAALIDGSASQACSHVCQVCAVLQVKASVNSISIPQGSVQNA